MNPEGTCRTICDIALDMLEEVSLIWMDRPSVTETDKGGVYDMD